MPTATTRIAASKQAERDRLVQEAENEYGLAADHPEDEQVLGTSPADIVDNLKARKHGWSCERVMQAFVRWLLTQLMIRAACAAQRKTNCLTEMGKDMNHRLIAVVFKEAMAEARAKDKELDAGGQAEGPFWGLPSSFKDTYNVVGVDSSLGCSPYCSDPTKTHDDEAALVRLFRKGGGIPFCKTNIPQTLLAFECANPVFGASSNPYSSARVPGGSSGGEAALITLRGTPVGWGSDIGGSLRIPAAYSGCCGLKPAVGRWPAGGSRAPVHGFEGIKAVVGPMARTVDDLTWQSRHMLTLVVQELQSKGLAAENVIPLPWREPSLPTRLKIGYWTDDGTVRASPAAARAVRETAAALRNAGHELIEWQPLDVPVALKIFTALTSADGYKQLLGNLGPDPMEPSMNLVTLGTRLPWLLKWLLVFLIKNLLKDFKFADILSTSGRKSAGQLWSWTAERDKYTKAFRKAAWEDNGFDFLLCPPQAVPALEHGRTKDLAPLAIGTLLFNVVDSTAGVLPVTRVDRAKDTVPVDYLHGSTGSWLLERRIYGTSSPAYDADKMHGLPVGVQLVGRQWEDEKVLAVMKIVEDMMGYE